MRNAIGLRVLAVMILFTAAAWAQSNDPKAALPTTHVAVARCAYNKAEAGCDPAAGDNPLAQIPRRGPGPPMRSGPYMRRPGVGYAVPYPYPAPQYNHAGMGALIGFGSGAALGASAQTDVHGRVAASLGGGFLFGVIGAAIGHAIPAFHFQHQYDPSGWPDADEQAAASNPKPVVGRRESVPAKPFPPTATAPLPPAQVAVSAATDAP